DSTAIDIAASNYTFRATGQILKFDGFLKVYPTKFEEAELPDVAKGDSLDIIKLLPEQHFTQPPPRYTDASLIKALEEQGVGRPSTYAPTLSTIQDRGYVEKNEQRRFAPTELGTKVDSLLVEHFPTIVDLTFTAKMEEQLDDIAEGEEEWVPMIKDFYDPFAANLEKKYEEVNDKKTVLEETDKVCPECKSKMVIRLGRYGKFYACSNFPECKHTENMEQEEGENTVSISCPECKEGKITPKRTRKGKAFYGCNKYPECDHALWDKPTGEQCIECKALLVEKRKKAMCSNKECSSLQTA
ncbi:MAG: DNA topoisomerase, partial [archaeon]|nr:DNA topoisomerase [archaeon]